MAAYSLEFKPHNRDTKNSSQFSTTGLRSKIPIKLSATPKYSPGRSTDTINILGKK